MGERTPHLDPDAHAALVGLAADHTRANIVRAIMEGVAFSLKDTLSIFKELGIPVRGIRLGGGGARSPLGARSRRMFTARRWKPCRPRKAPLMARASGRGGRRGLGFRRRGLRQSGACGQANGP